MYFKSFAVVTSLIASAIAADHTVMVGANSTKTFSPASFNASVGDIVHFIFVAGNHSLYQSTFADPCTLKADGFTNAFQPVAANSTAFTTISVAVNNTSPIWFYCPQNNTATGDHCHLGMVGAINPTAAMPFSVFQSAALALGNATPSGANTTSGSSSPSPSPTSPSGGNNTSPHANGVAQLRPSIMLTGSSVALLSIVASAMLAL